MIVPKKSLGQHFLNDPNIVRKIIQTAEITPKDDILEIGPGKGILTRSLCSCSRKVYAVEIDRELIPFLKNEFSSTANLELIEGDILKIDRNLLPSRFKVVANIPYQISSPLLGLLVQERKKIASMTLMVQREVAERIIAKPGTKEYSPLSIFIQFYASATIEFQIKKSSFSPPPKVDSSVVRILPLPRPRIETLDEIFFLKVVKSSFAHRRKSIRNSLKDEGFPSEQLESVFKKAPIDPLRRGETLTIKEYGLLSDELLRNT